MFDTGIHAHLIIWSTDHNTPTYLYFHVTRTGHWTLLMTIRTPVPSDSYNQLLPWYLLVCTPIAGLVIPALISTTLSLRWLGDASCLGTYALTGIRARLPIRSIEQNEMTCLYAHRTHSEHWLTLMIWQYELLNHRTHIISCYLDTTMYIPR